MADYYWGQLGQFFMDIYRENILDHYRNPRNFGQLPGADMSHEEYNPFCGDRLSFAFKSRGKLGIPSLPRELTDIKFSGEGCAISIASASMLTEKVKGMEFNSLRKLDKDVILEMLGIQLSPTRLKCALLPLEVLQKAINKVNSNR